jgi:hypothetical protein
MIRAHQECACSDWVKSMAAVSCCPNTRTNETSLGSTCSPLRILSAVALYDSCFIRSEANETSRRSRPLENQACRPKSSFDLT